MEGRHWERERGRPLCPPGMTESLMQKDPTWRKVGEWEWGRGHEGTLGFLSVLCPPSLKTHLSSFLCHTPFLHPLLTFYLQYPRLFTANSYKYFSHILASPKVYSFGGFPVTFHATCHFFVWHSGDWALWMQVCSLISQCSLAFGHTAVTITPSGPSYMQICVGSTAITILDCGRAISWLRALKQLNVAPPPPQQSFADVLGEILQEIIIFWITSLRLLCVRFILSLSPSLLWALQKTQSPLHVLLFASFLCTFFIIIQQHFSVRANAFWTASFLSFQAGCHCCCLWAGCIYLGVIGV